jgi:hypothetical protein
MARDICTGNSGSARTTPAGLPTHGRRAPPLLPVAVWTRTRIECAHSLELPSFRQARAKSASTSSASKSSSSTADDAAGSDGGKRRRKGPGSASSTSDAPAQGRRRPRQEKVSSVINFFPAPPARFGPRLRPNAFSHSQLFSRPLACSLSAISCLYLRLSLSLPPSVTISESWSPPL